MKPSYILLTILAVLVLTSCSGADTNSTYISSSDYAALNAAYQPVIDSWRQAVGERFGSDPSGDSHDSYQYLPEFNVSDWLLADIFYSYCDLDGNGVPEMLIAGYEKGESCYYPFDIYALRKNQPVRLLEQLTDRGFDRDTELLFIDPDAGVISYRAEGNNMVHCRIAADGCSAQLIEDADGAECGVSERLKALDWHLLASSAISKNAADYLEGYQPMQNAPEQYAQIIESCRREVTAFENVYRSGYNSYIVYELLSGGDPLDFEAVGEYPGTGLWEPLRSDGVQYGYGLHDINGDGIDELIMMYRLEDGPKNVFDIFTLADGQPRHLFGFYSRSSCTGISTDGRIFCGTSGGAACHTYSAYTIGQGGTTLSYEAVHVCGGQYTAYSQSDCDTGEYSCGVVEQPVSQAEGEALIQLLTDDDYSDDDAPFVEFVPMF